ncbi:hypothetical protein Tco_1092098 [Tanacetum coccineum]|uniref:Uncharacterized protein n=1 Tax=Tanacetum coccineum TaxID=301880 RepID=A0ABQ5I959_9ASTR
MDHGPQPDQAAGKLSTDAKSLILQPDQTRLQGISLEYVNTSTLIAARKAASHPGICHNVEKAMNMRVGVHIVLSFLRYEFALAAFHGSIAFCSSTKNTGVSKKKGKGCVANYTSHSVVEVEK